MFLNDIDRQINGVIQVNQDDDLSLKQELSEYVITTELRKHFYTFFDHYSKSLDTSTNKVGVWISGFYGSGKSHFLKMLSYLLGNKKVAGKSAIEYFKDKIEDASVFSTIKRCVDNPTETILFEISKATVGQKNDASIVRAMAKVFYNHLGYYGDDLKIVKLERFIEKNNKTIEFEKAFEEINGNAWIDSRDSIAFFEDDIVEVLIKVLDMSETSARNWFNGVENSDMSIDQLANDIDKYVKSKDKNFKLLFMIDEVGQYINTDVNLKLSLQGIVEKLGSTSQGQVWIVVTSQEAIDTFTKHDEMDFSGILGRFNTKLSLTSSSADEVIKKRILKKNDNAQNLLIMNYKQTQAILKNLFTFSDDCMMDLKGYRDENEYVDNYPFVPYQFTIIQKVFDAIRNYGIASKHQSSGERSLLDCYQLATQTIKNKDEHALVPFYYFYDTISNALDTTIRRVINRAQKAAENGDGILPQDVNLLKLLYLLRYLNKDIPSNIDNVSNLMIDDVRIDKIKLREAIKTSLDRLMRSNYVAKNSDKYSFLTDEEQDIARDIKKVDISNQDIRKSISATIFNEIYTHTKFKYGKYDFGFDKFIDDTVSGSSSGGVCLKIITQAGELYDKTEREILMTSGLSKEAIIILSDETPYFEEIEQAMKIIKFTKQRNISELPKTTQDIIRKYQDEVKQLKDRTREYIEKAILEGKLYVSGEKVKMSFSNARDKIEFALKILVDSVYTKLNLVNSFTDSDKDILEILNGSVQNTISESGKNNEEALAEVLSWIERENTRISPPSMGEIQRRYTKIPYGFREIDIASIIARLLVEQKIEIHYAGTIIDKTDRKMIDYLRKKVEIEKVTVVRHIPVDEKLIRKAMTFLRDYLDTNVIPNNEKDLVDFIMDKFKEKQTYYNNLLKYYENEKYPEKEQVISAHNLMDDILEHKKNNTALLTHILSKQDELLDTAEDTEMIETFFRTQKQVFDNTIKKMSSYRNERDYFSADTETLDNLDQVSQILNLTKPYNRIKDLPDLLQKIDDAYRLLLKAKKEEVNNMRIQCRGDVHSLAGSNCKEELKKADDYFVRKREEIKDAISLTSLDAINSQLLNQTKTICERIDILMAPPKPEKTSSGTSIKQLKSVSIKRYDLCPAKRLQSKEDIDKYVEDMRKKLYDKLNENDIVQVN